MAEVRLTIPAVHAELFKSEAADTLEMALDNVHEQLRWQREGNGDPSRLAYYRAKAAHAERLHDQVRDQGGTLLVDGDALVVCDTLEGCLIQAGDAVHGATEERRGPETRAKVRRTLAEVELWLSLLEQVEDHVGLEAVCA